MHELAIASDMITIIEESLGRSKKIKAVYATIGPLSGVSSESLRFCFAEVAGQRGLGNPELVIDKARAEVRCSGCGKEYDLNDFYSVCPGCGSFNKDVLSGEQCAVDSVELLEDDDV